MHLTGYVVRCYGPGCPREAEYKIASRDWSFEFYADTEGAVPPGDVEIHSELNETPQPGYRGTKTTLLDREPINPPLLFQSHHGRDHRDQRAARQVKIGDQGIDVLPAVGGVDENRRLGRGRGEGCVIGLAFQHSCRRCSDRDDAALLALGTIQRLGRRGINQIALAVHGVLR